MAIELPYMPTVKNVPVVFEKIAKAKVPDAFTTNYLTSTLGLKSTNDRALIPLFKKLGFLDSSGKPTPAYSLLKNKDQAKKTIADGIRKGYAALYKANEAAHDLPPDQLKGLVAQVSGTEEAMTKVIAMTFNALTKLADFSAADEAEVPTNEYFLEKGGEKTPPLPEENLSRRVSEEGGEKVYRREKAAVEIHIVQTTSCHPMALEFVNSVPSEEQSSADAIVDITAHRKDALIPLIQKMNGSGWIASNEEIQTAQELIEKNGKIKVSPNGALALAGLMQAAFTGREWDGTVVCVVGGE